MYQCLKVANGRHSRVTKREFLMPVSCHIPDPRRRKFSALYGSTVYEQKASFHINPKFSTTEIFLSFSVSLLDEYTFYMEIMIIKKGKVERKYGTLTAFTFLYCGSCTRA